MSIKEIDQLSMHEDDYMGEEHMGYFRRKLEAWKESLEMESRNTIDSLKAGEWNQPDITDRATVEADTRHELRTRDRFRKLIGKIDGALEKIENGSYGYCDETGEPIGVRRLDARPIATLCIEAQERHEKFERTHSDDE